MKLFLAMMLALGAGALLVAPATKAVRGAAQKTENAVRSTVDHTESLVAGRIDRWTEAVAASWDELQQKLLNAPAPRPFPQAEAGEEIVPPPPVLEPGFLPRRPLYFPRDFGGRLVPHRERRGRR